jgi:hypothetical protein
MSNSLISDRKINCSRQAELELLKAYPILFMIIIHVYENLSVGRIDPTPRTCLEHVLQFLAGPATAPAYMFAMGVGIIYSGNNAPKLLFRRGLRLFLGGYALNAARSGILTALGTALTGRFDPELTKYLFLNMDILHFAGLALMMSSLLFWNKIKPLTIVGVSLILQLIGRRLAMLPEMTSDFSYIAGHFYKCTPAGCFPLMQWYIYPAFGILFGTGLQRVSDLKAWYRQLGLCCAVFLLCYVGTLSIFGIDMSPFYSLANDAFYNQSLLSSVFSLLLIGVILSVSHPISVHLRGTALMDFAKQLSLHLNEIFVIQWILIGIWFSICRTFDLPDIPLGWVVPVGI